MPFKPSLMLVDKARILPKSEYLKGASLGYAPFLLSNIIPCWKGLPGTNTLDSYEH
jgi:hypothetical protein